MSLISVPNVFSAGAVIIASQHNVNFSTIYTDYNGNIDNTNIASGAAIVASKLDLTTANAIGTTTPAAGKFTTLEATTTFKLGTTHQGDIPYDNGTSIVRLTPGTSGYYLKTQGTSANPIWAAITIPTTFSQLFTSSGTFTAPAGVTKVYITMIGGGAGGGGCNSTGSNFAGGGGAGAYLFNLPFTVTPASNYTVTIGAGGAGGTNSGTDGSSGGTTSFDALSVLGGSGGVGSTSGTAGNGGAGGVGTGYDASASISTASNAGGGYTKTGGNGAKGGSGSKSGAGGGSPFGTGANGVSAHNAGTNGTANTGVGASGSSGTDGMGGVAGGIGGSGFVLVQY